VLDDVGFGQIGCYGSSIDTPAIDAVAARGLRYTNFHTTTICSSTRASLLTGRNHHAVGIGTVIDFCTGEYPGYTGRLAREAATTAEVLRSHGYATFAVGKWHLAARNETSGAGPFDTWPLGRGFERYYGFLGGATNQWAPQLVHDNHPIDPPTGPEGGYHLSEDLVDQALRMLRAQHRSPQRRPFYLYLAFGAAHEPHHVAREYIERYRGRFDAGWDVERERVFARQKALGVISATAQLPHRNTGVAAWTDLSHDERRLYSRMNEVFAGFLTHTDEQIGRLLDGIAELGLLDDTLVMVLSDNGASAEGGAHGYAGARPFSSALRQMRGEAGPGRLVVGMPYDDEGYLMQGGDSLEDCLRAIDELGSPRTYNHYPQGWAMAGNTPFQRYKGTTHYGGLRCPLVVQFPERIRDGGATRDQFHHAIDVHPTVLDVVGVESPAVFAGVSQLPIDGTSMTYTFELPDAPSTRGTQYFEMMGHRGIYHDGWSAAAFHRRGAPLEEDVWELYDVVSDPTESNDLASSRPEVLAAMIERWWVEAGRNDVLPLNDYPALDYRTNGASTQTVFEFPYGRRLVGNYRPDCSSCSYEVRADIDAFEDDASGVLFVNGVPHAGQVMYLEGGQLCFEHTGQGRRTSARSQRRVGAGTSTLVARCVVDGDGGRMLTLVIDGDPDPAAITVSSFGGGDEVSLPALDVGADHGPGMSSAYEPPFRFPGRIGRVVVVTEDRLEATSAQVDEQVE
jgi:arylsulfatase